MYEINYSSNGKAATIEKSGTSDPVIVFAHLTKEDHESAEDFQHKVKKVLRAVNPKTFVILIEFNTDGSSRDTWDEFHVEGAIKGALNDIGSFDVTKLEVSQVEGRDE